METPGLETTEWLSCAAAAEESYPTDPGFDKLLEQSLHTQPRYCHTHMLRQSVSAMAAWYAVFLGCGVDSGFTSPSLRSTTPPAHSENLYNSEDSWQGWIPTISMILGCIFSGLLISVFGRRKPLIFITIPLTLRWLLVAFFLNQSIQLAANIIGAMCSGFLWTLAPIYVGEISAPTHRGYFLALLALMSSMGSLFSHSALMFISKIFLAKILACSSICVALISFFSLESPYWLIFKGRTVDCIKDFGLLRGFEILAIKELKCLLDIETEHFTRPKYLTRFFALFKSQVLKPTAAVILFNTLAAFCGLHYLDLYSQRLFSTLTAKEWRTVDIQVTLESLKSLLLVLSCIFCKKYSRRSICIWSCICIFVTSLISTIYFVVTNHEPVSFILWVPLTCYIGYSCAVTMGLVPLSWVLSGEVLPLEARGFTACLANCLCLAAAFASTKATSLIESLANSTALYVMYGVTSLIFAFVMDSVLVETKGNMLIEIEKKYKRSSDNN